MYSIIRVWSVRSETPKILSDIRDRIDRFTPHDDYHMYDDIDAESYYRALDRVLDVLNRKIQDTERS